MKLMVFTKFSHFLEKYLREISLHLFSRKSLRNPTENFCIFSRNVSFAGNPSLHPLIIENVKSTRNIKNGLTPFDYCGCQIGLGTFRLFWNRFVLERGPSAKSFHSRSFFIVPFSFHSVPFRSELKNGLPIPFRSWVSYLKNGSIPLVPFLVKERFHSPRSVLGIKLYS